LQTSHPKAPINHLCVEDGFQSVVRSDRIKAPGIWESIMAQILCNANQCVPERKAISKVFLYAENRIMQQNAQSGQVSACCSAA
jgi:hypothetical protein